MNAFQVDLPKFELLEEVGHGGMATVYRARDKRLGREVAVKVIHRHLRENPEVARRFASEALAVAKVKHPNIVEVYDVSSDDESERYLVVELVRGTTLRQLLSEHPAGLPPEVGMAIGVEILRALSVAHRHGVIHRDIKPENVLVQLGAQDEAPSSSKESPARVKLTDFGIAKLLDAQGVTHTGQVLGSPAHMAPEQIEGGDVDARSDIFAVGVLLYELLTASLPFEGKNPAQVLRRVLEGTFVPPERLNPRIGATYGRMISKALSQSPGDRFATATEFADRIEAELLALGIGSVRNEVDRFVCETVDYEKDYGERIVAQLKRSGLEARKSGDVLRSAAAFNRALAYRPDDTMLLSAVSGLRHRGRLRRGLVIVGGAALAVGLTVGSAWLGRWYMAAGAKPVASEAPAPVASAPQEGAEKVPEPTASAQPTDQPRDPKPRRNGAAKPRSESPAGAAGGVRRVRTPLTGPQNARVRIDGSLYPWFNAHELSYGMHTFEFLPPNEECCETPSPIQVAIVPGDGEQVVRGTIRFRPATLELAGQQGGRASCGVAGTFDAQRPKIVPLTQSEMRLSCTVFAPSSIVADPKSIVVTLRPGQRSTINGF